MTTLPQLSAKAPTATTRSEIELLLCCARTHLDTTTAERIKILIQQGIDWTYLIQTAAQHGTMPLLYRSLNTTCPEAVPQIILSQLRNQFHSNALRNLFLTKELLKLLNLFEVHKISAIPFKGPVLAASVYGNLSLRQFCDLDVLVSRQDFLRTKDLLISQGYQLQLQLSWEYHFMHEDSRVTVDLHQAITPRYFPLSLDFERLWKRLKPLSFAGITVFTFLPEDLLLILCVKLVKDCLEGRERLTQICEVAELVHIYQRMDWEYVMKEASTLGSKRMLFLSLLLARDLLGVALPEEALQRVLADSVVKVLAEKFRKLLFHEDDGRITDLERILFLEDFEKVILYLRSRERLQERAWYFLHWIHLVIIPHEKDRKLVPLPASLSFLYYLLRPIRLVGKYGPGAVKKFLQK